MLLDRLWLIAEARGNDLAFVSGNISISYEQLRQRSRRLASALQSRSSSPSPLIAIYMRRDAHLLVAIVGVMASGAAYTVVEVEGDRDENIARLKTIAPDVVVTSEDLAPLLLARGLPAITEVDCPAVADDYQFPVVPAEHAAYVLFTSGSTGVPKGVAISHGNIRHYTEGLLERLGISEPLRYAHVSTLSADLGNTCLLLAMWTGGTLYLIDGDTRRDPRKLLDYLAINKMDFLKITPSHWRAIFNALAGQGEPQLRLQYLLLGGETLPVALARATLQSGVTRVLANHYGPTETTVGVTVNPIRDLTYFDTLHSDSVPIGLPFGHTRLLVRNEAGQYCDKATEGELFIGGPSVALGYRGNQQATDASFLTGIAGTTRFYKSGDFVSVDAAGVVSFLGRIDRQTKINGYRVELEHVERVLGGIPGIEAAAVYSIRAHDKNVLAAALMTKAKPLAPVELKQAMKAILPTHMIPTYIQWFEQFPLNANGKSDLKALRGLVEQGLAKIGEGSADSAPAEADPLHAELSRIWAACLRHNNFTTQDNFFDVGGDSLDAIMVISELQVRGYQISSRAFLESPTIAAIAAVISRPAVVKVTGAAPSQLSAPRRVFSAAQEWFFRQEFAASNHWNQALLLEAGEDVDEATLGRAIARLVSTHPLLRTAYRRTAEGWEAEVREPSQFAGFTVSHGVGMRASGAAQHILATARRLHQMIDLASGCVFRAHLFKLQGQSDHLLIICHHLSIDVVSWKLVLNDLVRFYSAERAGEAVVVPEAPDSFWAWAAHVRAATSQLSADVAYWHQRIAQAGASPAPIVPNSEAAAQTAWLAFSAAETHALASGLCVKLGVPLHVLLLAVFTHVLCRQQARAGVLIDIESHGRVALSEDIDISRTVGWFTSMYPVMLRGCDDPVSSIEHAQSVLSSVPNLGIAYGLLSSLTHREQAPQLQPEVCYNFLGDTDFQFEDGLKLSASRLPVGPARGADNDRVHALKLTARKRLGHLVVDLSFPSGRYPTEEMTALLADLKALMLRMAGIEAPARSALHAESGSSTGVITYIPRELMLDPAEHEPHHYSAVLLTGATGYIGAHVLHELLSKTSAHIYCLVRGRAGASPWQRLEQVFRFYFVESDLQSYQDRLTVIEGDVAKPRYGLDPALFASICEGTDAIYHFAAETRLFGLAEAFDELNISAVRTAILLASTGRPKDLHYMSTLAVCGINPGAEEVAFSEDSFDIGQQFQNDYERTKYKAERLIREFVAQGGSGFIYRSGNVSGHSRTGKMQINAGDNRLIQLLRAAAKVGKIPAQLRSTIVLSPVDIVAEGIVRLSLSRPPSGATLHIDSHSETSLHDIFAEMRAAGIPLEQTDAPDLLTIFKRFGNLNDPEVALGYFWASRRSRNVRYSHTRTHRLLARLGCQFTPLDRPWIRKFIDGLVQHGVLSPGAPSSHAVERSEPGGDAGAPPWRAITAREPSLDPQ